MNTVTTVRKGATQDEDRECPVKTSPCLSKCNSYLWMLGFQGKTTVPPPHTHTYPLNPGESLTIFSREQPVSCPDCYDPQPYDPQQGPWR